jgi:hypothetical protein
MTRRPVWPGAGAARSNEARSAAGQRLAGFIYGTIVAMSVLVAGARAFPDSPGRVAVLVTATCATFWLAHVYAHGLAHSVAHREHLSFAALRRIAPREGAIVEAAAPLVVALLLGAVGILPATAALWSAFAVGLVVLAVQALVFARVEELSWPATLLVLAINLGLGLALVALKLALTH